MHWFLHSGFFLNEWFENLIKSNMKAFKHTPSLSCVYYLKTFSIRHSEFLLVNYIHLETSLDARLNVC